ncbi:hypothetical protein BST22_13060 [Mycolicibacterium chubuense]|jgi:hypothetical protein|uniref:Uncharacterized protein n=1 Tax=Mycolicibacterium chubuense TaxID=1800 RepID=A0A0J6VX09_MYCCU|nr:hypothetical protein [Mycolicibacterium chubuense]KMO74664.1 hypothetical protein MCHUDSM44219_03582 [Mycolicibacterium chubuense]ORA52114.1 hypothetical protein BST22_13060 [Mycolicibacterium chubuense]SPY45223.1 Uncharacterised protein [Mycolicibacterium chubuense]
MADDVQSPDGAWWTVRRRWVPRLDKDNALGGLSLMDRNDRDVLFIATLIAVPLMVVMLPLSFAAKLSGLQRWEIEIERDEEWLATEKVRGWSASVDRIESITAEVRAGTYPAGAPKPGSDRKVAP